MRGASSPSSAAAAPRRGGTTAAGTAEREAAATNRRLEDQPASSSGCASNLGDDILGLTRPPHFSSLLKPWQHHAHAAIARAGPRRGRRLGIGEEWRGRGRGGGGEAREAREAGGWELSCHDLGVFLRFAKVLASRIWYMTNESATTLTQRMTMSIREGGLGLSPPGHTFSYPSKATT